MQRGPTIEVYRGDGHSFTVTITINGVVQDITGWTVWFTVKKNITDADSDAYIAKTITSHTYPSLGKTLILLDATDTAMPVGSYYYDIQMKAPSGEPMTIRGRFVIEQDITLTDVTGD